MSQLDQRKLQKQNESNILAFAVKVLSLELRCREAKCYFFFFSFYRKKIFISTTTRLESMRNKNLHSCTNMSTKIIYSSFLNIYT